jgi:dienelactone hydrolase
VVVIVPGSSGVSPNHISHAHSLAGAGFGVLLVDPFGSRMVTSTIANQTQYSFAASAYDVVAALRVLASDSRVDVNRISAQGHSRGGHAVVTAAVRQFADPIIGPSVRFAGVYAAYPWSGQQFQRPVVGATEIRAIIGERDDWGSVIATQAQVQAIRLCGGAATMRLVPDAFHSFDRAEPVSSIPEARVSPNAPIEYLNDDGSMISARSGVADTARTDLMQFREAVQAGFGQKGATMGGSPGLQSLFVEDMLAFHRRVLGVS